MHATLIKSVQKSLIAKATVGTQPEIGYHAYICNKSHQRMVRIAPQFAEIIAALHLLAVHNASSQSLDQTYQIAARLL